MNTAEHHCFTSTRLREPTEEATSAAWEQEQRARAEARGRCQERWAQQGQGHNKAIPAVGSSFLIDTFLFCFFWTKSAAYPNAIKYRRRISSSRKPQLSGLPISTWHQLRRRQGHVRNRSGQSRQRAAVADTRASNGECDACTATGRETVSGKQGKRPESSQ